jgi:hypothetical protein
VALRTFLAVAERLGLPVRERLLLLGIAKSTYTVWLKRLEDGELKGADPDKVDRMAYVLGIYELAGRVFPDGVAWLTRANEAPVFAGRRPLDRMLGLMEAFAHFLHMSWHNLRFLPISPLAQMAPEADGEVLDGLLERAGVFRPNGSPAARPGIMAGPWRRAMSRPGRSGYSKLWP